MTQPLHLHIDTHIRIDCAELERTRLKLTDLRGTFCYANPEYIKKERMGFFVGTTLRKLTLMEVDEREVRLGRGCLRRLLALLERERVEPQVVDLRVHDTGPTGLEFRAPFPLDPDQRSAARQAHLRRQGVIIGPCSSGKTSILLKLAALTQERTLVLVHTERILRDWIAAAVAHLGLPEKSVGVHYGKVKRDGDGRLCVGMVQTVANMVERDPGFARRWGCVLVDECHHQPANTISDLVNRFPALWRIGATATWRRKDGKDPLLCDAFGGELNERMKLVPDVLFEIRDEDLDRYGRIIPVDVVVVPTAFEFDLHCEKELDAQSWRRREGETAMASAKRFAKLHGRDHSEMRPYSAMLDAMVGDRERQARILSYLLPELAARRTCLLLGDRRELCLELQRWLGRRGVECGTLMGGDRSREADRTATHLADGSLLCAVGTTVADEGMNIPRLARGFGCTPAAGNPGRFTQQLGRFKRKCPAAGKADATYFYFWDHRVRSLRSHARAVAQAVRPPHRVWFSEEPGRRVPLSAELLRRLEGER